MSHYHEDDTDYMADEYEMEDIDDDMDDECHDREDEGSDSDADEFNSVCDILISYWIRFTHTKKKK